MSALSPLYLLATLSGGYKVYFLALLPVFYSLGVIDIGAVGWLGALMIAGMMIGSLVVHQCSKYFSIEKVLRIGVLITILSALLLLGTVITEVRVGIALAYLFMGIGTGVLSTAINALAGYLFGSDARYKRFAELAMLKDVSRIIVPIIIGVLAAQFLTTVALGVLLALTLWTLLISFRLRGQHGGSVNSVPMIRLSLLRNRQFILASIPEFLDTFASSTLFVFVPLIFLSSGYAIDDSIFFQSVVFAGYLVGRWVIADLATRSSGWRALAIAEAGMSLCIVFLLVVSNYYLLLGICFILGIFTRGTSPVIKSLAYNTLPEHDLERGAAVYSIVGDFGAITGQLVFGFLAAAIAVQAPFILSAVVALVVALYCFARMPSWKHFS